MALLEHDIEGNRYFNAPRNFPKTLGGKGLFSHTPFPRFSKPQDADPFAKKMAKEMDKSKFTLDTQKYQKVDLKTQLSTNQFLQRSFKIEKVYFTKASKFIDEERKSSKSKVKNDDKWYKDDKRHTTLHLRHLTVTEKHQKELLKAIQHEEKYLKNISRDMKETKDNTDTLQTQARFNMFGRVLGTLGRLATVFPLLGARAGRGALRMFGRRQRGRGNVPVGATQYLNMGGFTPEQQTRARGFREQFTGSTTYQEERRRRDAKLSAVRERFEDLQKKGKGGVGSLTSEEYRQAQEKYVMPSQRKFEKERHREAREDINARITSTKAGPFGMFDLLQSRDTKDVRRDLRDERDAHATLRKRGFTVDDIQQGRDAGYSPRDLVEQGRDKRSVPRKIGQGLKTAALSPLHPIKTAKSLLRGAGSLGRGIGKVGSMLGKFAPGLGAVVGGALAAKDFSEGNYFGGTVNAISGAASIVPGLGPVVGIALEALAMLIPQGWQDSFNKWAGPAFKKIWGTIAGPGSVLESVGGIMSSAGKILVAGWGLLRSTIFSDSALGFYKKIGEFFLNYTILLPFKAIKGIFDFVHNLIEGKDIAVSFIEAFKPVWDQFAEHAVPLFIAVVEDMFDLLKKGIESVVAGVFNKVVVKPTSWLLGKDISAEGFAKRRITSLKTQKSDEERRLGEEQEEVTKSSQALAEYTGILERKKADALRIMPDTTVAKEFVEALIKGQAGKEQIKESPYSEKIKSNLKSLSGVAEEHAKMQESHKTLEAYVQEKQKAGTVSIDKQIAEAESDVNKQQMTSYQIHMKRLLEDQAQSKKIREEQKKIAAEKEKTTKSETESEEAKQEEADREKSLAEKAAEQASKLIESIKAVFKIGGADWNFGDIFLQKSGIAQLGASLGSFGDLGGGGGGGIPGMLTSAAGVAKGLFGAGTGVIGAGLTALGATTTSAMSKAKDFLTGKGGSGGGGGDLSSLAPQVATKAEKLIELAAQEGITLRVTSAKRSSEEQARLYAQGRTTPGQIITTALPGSSLHERGLAFDVVPVQGGQENWNSPQWQRIGALGRQVGLRWGGDFKSFKDKVHFDLPGGETIGTEGAAVAVPSSSQRSPSTGGFVPPTSKTSAGNDAAYRAAQSAKKGINPKTPQTAGSTTTQQPTTPTTGGGGGITFPVVRAGDKATGTDVQQLVYATALESAKGKGWNSEQTKTFLGLLAQESRFGLFMVGDRNRPGMSIGPGQMGVREAAMFGYSSEDRYDPVKGTKMSADYFDYLMRKNHGDPIKALGGYNKNPEYPKYVQKRVGELGPGILSGLGGAVASVGRGAMDLAQKGWGSLSGLLSGEGIGEMIKNVSSFAGDMASGSGITSLKNTLGKAFEDIRTDPKVAGSPIGSMLTDLTGALAGDVGRTMLGIQGSPWGSPENTGAPSDAGTTHSGNRLTHTLNEMNQLLREMAQREDPVKNTLHGSERDRMVETFFRQYTN